jgi:hypothetical protein
MNLEMKSIKENGTFLIKTLPEGEKAIGCRWVFKRKMKSDGTIDKYKARLVAKGYSQQYGKDYIETFAPVAKFKSIRTIFALAAIKGWKVYHDDATSAFLNGTLKESVYMDQPKGFSSTNAKEKWLLIKALYGLKQAPREWNSAFDDFMISEGFTKSLCDPCLYFKIMNGSQIIVGIYVDDTITTGANVKDIDDFRLKLKTRFKCSEGGLLNWCLGMEVKQLDGSISLNQTQYLAGKIAEFELFLDTNSHRSTPLDSNFQQILEEGEDSTEVDSLFPYRSMVGSLSYLANGTRPDISAAVGVVSRFLFNPKLIHCNMVKRIYYYLRQTMDYSLIYKKNTNTQLLGYCDASWGNNEDYSLVSGYAFLFGGNLVSWSSKKQSIIALSSSVSWSSKKQSIIALSSSESESVAATHAAQEALWFQQLLEELGIRQKTIHIYEDNQGCIALTKNPQESKRTRHIQIKYHFIRNHVKSQRLNFLYCPTQYQLADLFTKGVNGTQLRSGLLKLRIQRCSQQERELK